MPCGLSNRLNHRPHGLNVATASAKHATLVIAFNCDSNQHALGTGGDLAVYLQEFGRI
jgi:hypothetical protein